MGLMVMIRIISNSSIPIYEQVQLGLEDLIIRDGLRGGEKLPSVRELAFILTVNPNTISKAYTLLEKKGIIETIKGKGTFIKFNAKYIVLENDINKLKDEIKNVINDAVKLKITLHELFKIEEELYRSIEGENHVRNKGVDINLRG